MKSVMNQYDIRLIGGAARAVLFPVYSWQHALFLGTFLIIPILTTYLFNSSLSQYVAVGAFAGYVISVYPSTPALLEIDSQQLPNVTAILRKSKLYPDLTERLWSPPNKWFRYWRTDILKIIDVEDGNVVRLCGRLCDLQLIAMRLRRL